MSRKPFNPWTELEKNKPTIDWSQFVEISLEEPDNTTEPVPDHPIFTDSESSSSDEEEISDDEILDLTKDINMAYNHVKKISEKISVSLPGLRLTHSSIE